MNCTKLSAILSSQNYIFAASFYSMYPETITGLHLHGVYIHEPGSVITNFFILLWSVVLLIRLKANGGFWTDYWRIFLLCLGLASFGGMFTHGVPLMFTKTEFYALWGLKNAFIVIGNLFATMALLRVHFVRLLSFTGNGLLIFLVLKAVVVLALMVSSKSFTPVVIDLGFTYIFALATTFYYRNQFSASALLFKAFLIAFLSGLLYTFPWHVHPQWLTNSDVVHIFALWSMAYIARAAVSAPEIVEVSVELSQ